MPPPNLLAKYPDMTVQQLSRGAGEIDLLLGMDVVGLHPVTIRTEGNQRVMGTKFGVGKLLVGVVPGVESQQVNAAAARLSRGSWERPVEGIVHRVQAYPAPLHSPSDLKPFKEKLSQAANIHSLDTVEQAWQEEMKDLEPRPLRSCRPCVELSKNCPQCNFRAKGLSEMERRSVTFMQDRMQHDPLQNCINVEYPLVSAADRQPNNIHQIRVIQSNIEKRTDKDGLRDAYNAEMQRMLDAKAVRELTEQEMRAHQGGVHYMPHFPVMNPDSASTPLRIVVDSKCINKRSGLAFNDLIAPVPNALNDILDVILRWRQFPSTLLYDLSKAYHTLRTGVRELHLRRFLYRFDVTQDWKSYGYVVVAFGDKPAALALELAKELTASISNKLDPMAARQLTLNSLVDDVGGGGTVQDVERMRGVRNDDGSYSGTVSRILKYAGFKAKALVPSGTELKEEREALGGKFLGLSYDVRHDTIEMSIAPIIRMTKRRSRQRRAQVESITDEWLEDLRVGEKVLTRRRVLAFIMSQYDPLGLLSHFMLTGKLLLRRLYGKDSGLGWDDELPQADRQLWQSFITNAVNMSSLRVPRAVLPQLRAQFWIVGYWDGSLDAHACCIYSRVQLRDVWDQDVGVSCDLMYAKTRVAPKEGTTISKMEVQGLVELTRSLLKIILALEQRVDRVILVGDSMCAHMAIRKPGTIYKVYLQNRVAEIQSNMQMIRERVGLLEETQKIAGAENPADLGTRAKLTARRALENDLWTEGPAFMRLPRSTWPITTPEDVPGAVPASELRRTNVLAVKTGEDQAGQLERLISSVLERSGSLDKAKGVLVRVLRLLSAQAGNHDVAKETCLPREREAALKLMMHHQQQEVRKKWAEGKLSGMALWQSRNPHCARGLLVTRGRFPTEVWQRLTGLPYLPVLPGNSRLAWLILKEAHEANHRQEVGAVMAISRRTAWVLDARRVTKKIIKSCMWCQRQDVKHVQQRMGLLPPDAMDRVRPFQVVGLDLMGPLSVAEGRARRRVVVKVWVAVYVCLCTRAVACWVIAGYDADSFIKGHMAHTAVYGTPSKITTDQGTQLVAAAKRTEAINWEALQQRTAREGTTWEFVTPGSPWRNGSAERAIGLLKRSLAQQITVGALLTPLDLQTFLHRAASMVNERPLTARSFSVEDFWAITPRDLLLGAAPSLPKAQEWQVGLEEDWEARMNPRVDSVEEKVRLWWKSYSHDVFPLLVPLRKWQRLSDVVDVGAIVLVQYAARFARDRYRLARVLRLLPGRDGVVRTVLVGMRNARKGAREPRDQSSAGLSLLKMPVQRLVMILPGSEQPDALIEEVRLWVERQEPLEAPRPVVPQPGIPVVQVDQGQEEIIDL